MRWLGSANTFLIVRSYYIKNKFKESAYLVKECLVILPTENPEGPRFAQLS